MQSSLAADAASSALFVDITKAFEQFGPLKVSRKHQWLVSKSAVHHYVYSPEQCSKILISYYKCTKMYLRTVKFVLVDVINKPSG